MHNTWLKNHSYYFICTSVVVIAFLVYALSPYLFSSESDVQYCSKSYLENIHRKSNQVDQSQSDDLQIPLQDDKLKSHSHQNSSVSVNNKATPRLLSSQSSSKSVSVSHQLKVAVSSKVRAQTYESAELVANSGSARSKSRPATTQGKLTSQKFSISSDSVKIKTLSVKTDASKLKGSLPLGDDLWYYFFFSIIFFLFKIRSRIVALVKA